MKRVYSWKKDPLLASEEDPIKLFEEIENSAKKKSASGFDQVMLLATAADIAIRMKDEKVIHTNVSAIQGKTLDQCLRLKYYLRAAKLFEGDAKQTFLAAAKTEAESCSFPKLKKQLLQQAE